MEKSYKNIILVLIVFFFSFVPRFFLLSKGPFHWDTVDFLFEMKDKSITGHSANLLSSSFVIF